jgi:hypothetical protein
LCARFGNYGHCGLARSGFTHSARLAEHDRGNVVVQSQNNATRRGFRTDWEAFRCTTIRSMKVDSESAVRAAPTDYRLLTVSDLFTFFAGLFGLFGGAKLGWDFLRAIGGRLFGAAGAVPIGVLGATILGLVGMMVGYRVAKAANNLVFYWPIRGLKRWTTEDIWTRLKRDEGYLGLWGYSGYLIAELRNRGEPLDAAVPLLLRLMGAKGSVQRATGWKVLRTYFPALAAQAQGYGTLADEEARRAAIERVRALVSATDGD